MFREFRGGDRRGLGGQGLRPGLLLFAGLSLVLFVSFVVISKPVCVLVPAGFLVLGPQPADGAGGFFGGALGVHGHKAGEDFGVGQVGFRAPSRSQP